MPDPDYLDLSLRDFLDAVAAPTPAPGAGAVAATSVALAAGLAAMAAGLSGPQLGDAEALVARARQLQQSVAPLAGEDADAYSAVLAARRLPDDDPARTSALTRALSLASDVPLKIAELGAEVAVLARRLADHGNPNLRGDATVACLLARAGVESAVTLVQLNLEDRADPRLAQARRLLETVHTSWPDTHVLPKSHEHLGESVQREP
jgi:formiminotetrahydrofolate cyclodeaminase